MQIKYFILFLLLLGFGSLNAQSRFSIGLNGGIGQSYNSAYDDYYSQKVVSPDYSYGLNVALRVGSKHRIRLESAFNKTSIGRTWPVTNIEVNQPSKSTLRVYYLDLNLRFDYSIYQHNKLNVYLSPGIKWVNSMGTYEKTKFTNGDEKTSHYLNIDYKKRLTAGAFDVLVKYDVTKHIGITLSPGYTYYFKKFFYKCDNTFQQMSVNAGVEWTF